MEQPYSKNEGKITKDNKFNTKSLPGRSSNRLIAGHPCLEESQREGRIKYIIRPSTGQRAKKLMEEEEFFLNYLSNYFSKT